MFTKDFYSVYAREVQFIILSKIILSKKGKKINGKKMG